MYRKIWKELITWKKSQGRKPLILNGARQVGKTYILKEFGAKEFKNFAYLNCDKNPRAAGIFSDFDTERIIRAISAVTETVIEKENTLIFIDEIQEIPNAVSCLKYFCEDAPEYYIVAAGSLLGIRNHEETSFPVGKVNSLQMYPMTFDEFLRGIGREKIADYIAGSSYKEISALKDECIELLRQYYFTGGMPEAVDVYAKTKDIWRVRGVQNQILSEYADDISKHADKNILPRINLVWNSIPSQLVKENKKFIYGAIKKGARAAEFETAIRWLIDAGLVHKVSRVTKASVPLKFYEDLSAFKLFMNDCGLLGALSQTPPAEILVGSKIFEEYKGAFTEQYVFQQLNACPNLFCYYYTNENSTLELDFLVQKNSEIIPIEVKAEENLKSKSLRTFTEKNKEIKGLRFSMSDYRDQNWMQNIPLYCVEKWGEE